MADAIEWGREIPVDGKRPAWLKGLVVCDVKTSAGWRYPRGGLSATFAERWSWNYGEGTPCITAIRLPADHFAYKAINAGFEPWLTDGTVPADWDGDRVLLDSGFLVVPTHWRREPGIEDIIGYRRTAGMGDVLWWRFPIDEAPYVGSPIASDWPGYHTHFTPLPPMPRKPKRGSVNA